MKTMINIQQHGILHTRSNNVVSVTIMSFTVYVITVLAPLKKMFCRVCLAAVVAVVVVLCDPAVETQAKTPLVEDEFDYLDDVKVSSMMMMMR